MFARHAVGGVPIRGCAPSVREMGVRRLLAWGLLAVLMVVDEMNAAMRTPSAMPKRLRHSDVCGAVPSLTQKRACYLSSFAAL